MKKTLFTLAIFALLLMSCGKPVSEVNPDFIGTWVSTDLTNGYTLVIQPNNEARWDRTNLSTGDTVETFLGTAKIKDNDKMVIGNLKLQIDEYPTFDPNLGTAGEWICKLETWPFVRL